MDEQQLFQVVWGTSAVPAVGWGVKVFADTSETARNATEAQRFYNARVQAGVECKLQTILGVTIMDSGKGEAS